MGRPRKIKPENVETEVAETIEIPDSIATITTDFNRADLNELRDKINEIISHLAK